MQKTCDHLLQVIKTEPRPSDRESHAWCESCSCVCLSKQRSIFQILTQGMTNRFLPTDMCIAVSHCFVMERIEVLYFFTRNKTTKNLSYGHPNIHVKETVRRDLFNWCSFKDIPPKFWFLVFTVMLLVHWDGLTNTINSARRLQKIIAMEGTVQLDLGSREAVSSGKTGCL
jgi:hypothetical protein